MSAGVVDYLRTVVNARQRCAGRVLANKLPASVDCIGGSGDGELRAKLARAASKLEARTVGACAGVTLALLDYPGPCEHPGGASFEAGALFGCVESNLDRLARRLLETYFPQPLGVLRGKKRRCVARTAKKGFAMVLADLQARTDCLLGVEGGELSGGVDCRAALAPHGPGTGDVKTDRRLRDAYVAVGAVAVACAIPELDTLGYQRACADGSGGSFSPIDLRACVFDENRRVAPEILELGFPTAPACGNGRLEGDEECDDGLQNSDTAADACRADCRLPICGDGVTDPGNGEGCDDGNAVPEDGCDATCTVEGCGDGVLQAALGEQCDEGAGNSDTIADSCRRNCRLPTCGDGVVDPSLDEACDDGNRTDNDGCDADCIEEGCGDGIVQAGLGEQCDDGPANSNTTPDACRSDCSLPRCGDGVVDPSRSEECDDRDSNQGDGCRNDCTVCGNGVVAGTEQCDDGPDNSDTAGDACRLDCTLPFCGDGVTDSGAGETCDDANDDDRDPCLSDCTVAACGDAVLCDRPACTSGPGGAPEECDAGGANSDTTSDACRQNCARPRCGDGTVDSGAGEICDTTPSAACASDELCTDECFCSHLCPGVGQLELFAGAGPPCATDEDCVVGSCDDAVGRCRTETGLDSGWKGLAHRGDINDGVVSRAFLECPAAGPTCGECNVTGIQNSTRSCRCSVDLRTPCDEPFEIDVDDCSFGTCIDTGFCIDGACSNEPTRVCQVDNQCGLRCSELLGRGCMVDSDCGPHQCQCFFGPPFPLSSGGTPACVLNRFFTDVTGTGNVDTGEGRIVAELRTRVFLGELTTAPCPYCGGVCADDPLELCAFDEDCATGPCDIDPVANDGVRGGVCIGGGAEGLPCDVMAENTSFPARSAALGGGGHSLDCPPDEGVSITPGDGLVIDVEQSTGRSTLTASLPCIDGGDELCHCKQCSQDPTVGCRSNADCIEQGGACERVNGSSCLSNDDCIGVFAGTCRDLGVVRRCAFGLTTGLDCETNADCLAVDGGECELSSCTNSTDPHGIVPQPNGCTDLNCMAVGDDNAECVSPVDKETFCDLIVKGNGDGILTCFTNLDCDASTIGQDGGECTLERKFSCFGPEIVAEGAAHPEFPIGAATFCIPATNNGSINGVAGLPGPGRVRNQGRSTTFCANDPDVRYLPGVGGCPTRPTSRSLRRSMRAASIGVSVTRGAAGSNAPN